MIRLERDALEEVERRVGEKFADAVELIARSRGRVIVTGVGKSGLVGRKIAATLTSTGTPATFLHPADSVHGDLGIVGSEDVVILLSKSGESAELLELLQHLKLVGVRTVAVTGRADSTLARHSDVALDAWVREEACPFDLAPTTSTTAALALGDALAVALLEVKGFRREDFARIHPGGALGRRLLLRVADVMVTDPLPLLAPTALMKDTVVPIAELRGLVIVIDQQRRLLGVLTSGDLARTMERDPDGWGLRPIAEVMTRHPQVATTDELASAAVYRMEQGGRRGIMAMPVLDDLGTVVGVVHLHDLMRAGVA